MVGDSKGWASVTWRDQNYSPRLTLPADATLRLDWRAIPGAFATGGKAPQHSCGTKDIRGDAVLGPIAEHYGPRNWSNGEFAYTPDFAQPADLADVELAGAKAEAGKLKATGDAGVAVFRLPLPYAYVSATLEAGFEGGEGRLYVSRDAGKTWAACRPGDISPLVKQAYDVWLKAEFPGVLAGLSITAIVEHNRGAQPHLCVGRNAVTVACEPGSLSRGTAITVTYAFQEATAHDPAKRTRWDGRDITYGATRTVTRTLATLPATFTIDVGGNTQPRMISLERAVRGK